MLNLLYSTVWNYLCYAGLIVVFNRSFLVFILVSLLGLSMTYAANVNVSNILIPIGSPAHSGNEVPFQNKSTASRTITQVHVSMCTGSNCTGCATTETTVGSASKLIAAGVDTVTVFQWRSTSISHFTGALGANSMLLRNITITPGALSPAPLNTSYANDEICYHFSSACTASNCPNPTRVGSDNFTLDTST